MKILKIIVSVLEIRTRKQKIVIDTDTDSDTPGILPEVPEKPKAAVRGRTRKTDVELDKDEKVRRILFKLFYTFCFIVTLLKYSYLLLFIGVF